MTELTGRALDAAIWKARGNEVYTHEQMLREATQVWGVQPACRVFLMGFAAMHTQSGWIFEQTDIPNYSTDIASAFGLVEAMRGKGYRPLVNVGSAPDAQWHCCLALGDHYTHEHGESAPEAIARAALSVLSQEGR